MNLFKKISTTLSITLFLWGCSDNNEPLNETNATLSLSTSEIKVDGTGGEAIVTVTSSDNWRLAGIYDWAHPSATSGKSGDEVTFRFDPNTEDEVRNATFKFFIGSTVVPLQVVCTPVYTVNLLTEQEINLPKEKKDISIKFESNVSDLAITYSEDSKEWLTFQKQSEFIGKTSLMFSVTENKTYKVRSASITIESPQLTEPVMVTITQAAVPYFNITPTDQTQKFDLSEQTISFTIESNIEYTPSIVTGSEWITEQKISESQPDDRGLTITTLSYKLSATDNARVGKIRVENTKKNVEFTIIQIDPNMPAISISNNTIANYAVNNGWIVKLTDSEYILSETGKNATEFACTSTLSNLNGLENFPNLNTISIKGNSSLEDVDISRLHNVTSLTITGTARWMKEFNFGDNPIETFNLTSQSYLNEEKLIFTGSKIKEINFKLSRPNYDETTSIDLSECPVLQTFKHNGESLKTLYLKTGQSIPTIELYNKDYKIEYK